MEANKILQADVLDILFENRNKKYGAYELRQTYNRRVVYALSGMGIVCLLFIGITIFANGNGKTNQLSVGPVITLTEPPKESPKEELKVVPPKPKPQMASVKYTIPKIVPPDQVKPEDMPPPNADLVDVHIGPATVAGEKGDYAAPPVEIATGKLAALGKEDEEGPVMHVQIEAKFPGGFPEWEKFLRRNLRAELPTENGAAPGTYSVIVSFVVDKEGNIADVKAENDPGYGAADEAVRVIKKSGQWVPAVQNGRNVMYRQKQKISFVVEDGN